MQCFFVQIKQPTSCQDGHHSRAENNDRIQRFSNLVQHVLISSAQKFQNTEQHNRVQQHLVTVRQSTQQTPYSIVQRSVRFATTCGPQVCAGTLAKRPESIRPEPKGCAVSNAVAYSLCCSPGPQSNADSLFCAAV